MYNLILKVLLLASISIMGSILMYRMNAYLMASRRYFPGIGNYEIVCGILPAIVIDVAFAICAIQIIFNLSVNPQQLSNWHVWTALTFAVFVVVSLTFVLGKKLSIIVRGMRQLTNNTK